MIRACFNYVEIPCIVVSEHWCFTKQIPYDLNSDASLLQGGKHGLIFEG
jgi:hypothetical protein